MYEKLKNLDRRWIFLLMLLAIALPILFQIQFPEQPSPLVQSTYDQIENLPDGSDILLAFDYDPATEGELGPMATTFVRHCALKKHKMYFIALWPLGPQMIDDKINLVIKRDFPERVEGKDYCNLGYKPGNEGVIKVIVTDLRQLYTTDHRGTNIDRIPMCRGKQSVQDFDLLINVSGGYPGTKEWILYGSTPYPDKIKIVAGNPGVQSPLMYPYIPEQLKGLLASIKGAAEYETLVLRKYPSDEAKYHEGLRRMGPQLVAHMLMITLIIAGNGIYFWGRWREKKQ